MAGSIANLAIVANQTKDAFNNGDMATVREHLADDLVVKSLGPRPRKPNGVVRTFTASTSPTAQQALSDQTGANSVPFPPPPPHFQQTQVNFAPPGGTANQATITGEADWTDEHGTDHIKFVFRCVFDPERGWLFQNVSATAG